MIGVFDSGLGGLSVLREVRALYPAADLVYVADRARAPYGIRAIEDVRELSVRIADWLVETAGASTLVVACNTASAAALEPIRSRYPDLPVVGMEPAVKPAASTSRTRTVGVFATHATFQGELYETVIRHHGGGVRILDIACPEWVELVEQADIDSPKSFDSVRRQVEPALARGADMLVLGCTHFSFLSPLVNQVAEGRAEVIDPSIPVARQVGRVATTLEGTGQLTLVSSGDPEALVEDAWRLAAIKTTRPALPFLP